MASPNEGQGPVTVRSQRRRRPRLCRANVRAGRPRSRVGIIHPTNREHDLHHAQEQGKGPFASLKNHSPLEGESQSPSRMAKADAEGGTAPAPPARCRVSLTGRGVPPPTRPRAEPHPGTRASRPQPYSWLEEMERQRKVAGRQPPSRRERRWPVRMKGKAPFRVDPSGGVGQGCAGQMCGRDARVPGWASSTQQTGNMIYTTPRNGARGRLQASVSLPP